MARKFLTLWAFSVLLAMGCQAVKYIGAVPLEDYQVHVEEVQRFAKDVSTNQGEIAGVASQLAQENALEAKAAKDDAKLERSVEAKIRLEGAAKTANKLADSNFTKTESPPWDFEGILMDLLKTLSGAALAYFGVKIPMGRKLTEVTEKLHTVKSKARKYGSTNETFDVDNDKDLS